ncbi:hypothetical protein R9X44_23875 [Actinocorallia sp. A-T 12471]|nr:hypothetical protein [Actinocorallia sp. A-T 12471]MDX6742838.1 hypothetical protein [Actinocorallia sp. A-T 12471]
MRAGLHGVAQDVEAGPGERAGGVVGGEAGDDVEEHHPVQVPFGEGVLPVGAAQAGQVLGWAVSVRGRLQASP